MKFPPFQLAFVLFLFGCSDQRTASTSQSEHHEEGEQKNRTLQVPVSSQFSVDVQLSDAAQKKLIDSKETIIVAGFFTGRPIQGTEARYLDIKTGAVVLGDVKQEIHSGETAIFNELNLNPDALARIDSQGPDILIDVYSGRRSSKSNLLDCEYYDGSFESIRGRRIVVRCQLIAERVFPQSGLAPD